MKQMCILPKSKHTPESMGTKKLTDQSRIEQHNEQNENKFNEHKETHLFAVPYAVAKTEAKRTIMKQWQKEWKESENGRHLYKYVKKISDQQDAQLELPRHEFGVI